jgi:dienelactone hydrolase
MTQSNISTINLELTGAEIQPALKSYSPVTILSNRGNIYCRLYTNAHTPYGAVWLNNAVGGWAAPAKNLYPRIGRLLAPKGIASLQLSYRQPGNLQECILDALAGVTFLQSQGCSKVAMIGHAFGGAVAIQAAAILPIVKCVVTLATQTSGASPISTLRNDCAILLIHGTADRVLPASCSETLFQLAHEPKRLLSFDQAGHNLDEVSSEIYLAVSNWLDKNLIGQGM